MDEITPTKEGIEKEKPKRLPNGRFIKGVAPNPLGNKGPRQLTAQQFIDSMYKVHGKEATDKIFRLALQLAAGGDVALLCKILDKILPSKVETKGELLVTHREEFLKMRARAMQILGSIGAELN